MSDPVAPEPGSLRRQAARGSAVTLAAQVAKILLSLASVVLLSRLVAPGQFGLVVMVTAISGVASIFLDFGLSMSALRTANLTQQQQSNLFWLNVGAGTVLAIVVFLLSWPIAAFYGEPQLIVMTQWLSITFILGGLTAQFRVHMNRAMRFTALAVTDVLAPTIALAVAIAFAALGYGIAALLAQVIIASAVLLVLSMSVSRWWPGLPRRTAGMRALISFGGWFAGTQLLSYATRNIDSIAIGRVWGPIELGLYDRAFKLSVAPITQINFPMTRIAMPVLARVVDDSKRFVAALREAQLIACYVTSSVLLVIGGAGTPLVTVLLGEAWATAGPLLGVLAIGATFRAIQQVGNWVLVAKGMGRSLLKFNLLAQPMVILLILAGLPWGALGVAVGGALGYGLYWLVSLLWAARATELDLRPLMANAIRIIGSFSLPAGLLAWLAATFVPLAPIWQLAIGVGAATAWFGTICLLSASVRQDMHTLIRFARLAVGRG